MMKKLTYLFLMSLIAGCTPDSEFEKYKKHVVTLASDEFEGRAPGTCLLYTSPSPRDS